MKYLFNSSIRCEPFINRMGTARIRRIVIKNDDAAGCEIWGDAINADLDGIVPVAIDMG